MKIVVLGAPGAGKGTHCKRIAERYGVVHLSSGDILRRERAQGSELGKKAHSAGYVLDGFPRTVHQAEALDKSLASGQGGIDIVINLQVSDDVVVERITGRRSCPMCGAVYHVKNMPPKVDEICDLDGTKLVQRPDDTEEVVRNRLETYYRQTEPVVGYYRARGAVHDMDANADADTVADMIFQELDAFAGK
jgi:adenylate kinase